jgi:hypothetical protein
LFVSGQFSKKSEGVHIFGLLASAVNVRYYFLQKLYRTMLPLCPTFFPTSVNRYCMLETRATMCSVAKQSLKIGALNDFVELQRDCKK